ncbi:MAG: hypothetical protein JWQ21_3196 [Herminiimonas sp.]|nr:hypothetical protein [Herminiimonas sp.]
MSDDVPLYAGLSGLDLSDEPIDFGKGIVLSKAYAHVMSTILMAFAEPEVPGRHHPTPYKAASGGVAIDIRAELAIPATYNHRLVSRFDVVRMIVCVLRLWSDPEITLTVVSKYPFSEMPSRPDRELVATAVEVHQRFFRLALIDHAETLASIDWVRTNWETAVDLSASSAEFKLAMAVFEIGQFIPSSAMVLVSIWGALEAIFSPSTTELRFRVSAHVAAYLEPAGPTRLSLQQRVAKLYDKRSAAAHGKPKHDSNDLLQSFELLRRILIKMIDDKKVPSKNDLDAILLGGVNA